MAVITLTQTEYLIYASGLGLLALTTLALVLILLWTPATTFLIARFRRLPIFALKGRDGNGTFKLGSSPGATGISKVGEYDYAVTENSHWRDRKSGAVIYDAFTEYAATIDREYAPILQELREAGFKIKTFRDYQHLARLHDDKAYRTEFYKAAKAQGRGEEAKRQIKSVLKHGISIKPFKTYEFGDLSYKFPNNISPVFFEARITEAQKRAYEQAKKAEKMMPYIVAILALLVGAAIAWKIFGFGTPVPTEVVCRVAQSGIETASSNLTATVV